MGSRFLIGPEPKESKPEEGMGLEASELARWTRFAAKGGIGKCTATCDCVAESVDDLMFFKVFFFCHPFFFATYHLYTLHFRATRSLFYYSFLTRKTSFWYAFWYSLTFMLFNIISGLLRGCGWPFFGF